jgi:hypothetical protein
MRRAFAAVALFALLVGGTCAADTPTDAPPDIHIFSCKALSGPTLLPSAYQSGLAVRFENNGSQPYTSILWRAKYGDGYIDFLDDGTFSPQIRIDNFLLSAIGKAHVNILGALLAPRGAGIPIDSEVHFSEYASLDNPENCRIIKAVAADGSVWMDSSVPQAHYVLPAPAPSSEASLAPDETEPHGLVDISHCHLLFPATHRQAEADIGFRVVAPGKVVDAVTFRVSYGRGTLDYIAQGNFADDSYQRYKLHVPMPDSLGSYFSLDDPKNCTAVSVHYADGTQWTNPAAPAALAAPTPVPDALDYGLREWIVNWTTGLGLPAPSPSVSPTPSTSS